MTTTEDNPIVAALWDWREKFLGSDDVGDDEFGQLIGWVRGYTSEDGLGIPKCGTDPAHRTSWVVTSSVVHPVGSGRNFGPYPNRHILWCSDCKRVLILLGERGR